MWLGEQVVNAPDVGPKVTHCVTARIVIHLPDSAHVVQSPKKRALGKLPANQ